MRPTISINVVGEQMLVCHKCGTMFLSADPDRHYCDQHLVERVNGTGILEDDQDDLFALRTNICGDCGVTFQTSRPARLCALCAGPRATVGCPACGLEHQVPILAPTKLCGPCRVDLDMTESSLRVRLAAADAAYTEAVTRLDADLAHADERDQARYAAALAQEEAWGPERFARAVEAAIERADGLSPLLSALLAMRRANDAAGVDVAAVWQGLRAVEEARGL